MSRSNWLGSSGWATINDPTDVLTGRVLVATAGTTQYNEDYLITLAGTATAFNVAHYAAVIDYAFPQNVNPTSFSAGIFGLVSRAGNFTGTPLKPQDCYIGRINRQNNSAEIVKRVGGVDSILASSTLPKNSYTFGSLHTMRLNTYGTQTSGVNLQFVVDNETLVAVGDNSVSALTTGFAGIQASSGTAYADNFTILQYTDDGTAGYNGWLPNNSFTRDQLIIWLRSDTGLNYLRGSTITSWQDQSGNALHLNAPATVGQPAISTPISLSNATVAVRFDNSDHRWLLRTYDAKLDFNLTGTGTSAVYLVRNYKETIGDNKDASNDDMISPVANMGRMYQYRFVDDPSAPSAPEDIKCFEVMNGSGGAAIESALTTMYTIGSYEIIIWVANGAGAPAGSRVAGSTEYGFWRNGNQERSVTQQPASTDRDNTPNFQLGKRTDGGGSVVIDEAYAYASYDMVEMQMYNFPLLGADRQKVEGYLAWKYGLASSLPVSHPYRNSPPSV